MNENTMNNDVTMDGRASVLASRYRIIKQLGQGGMGSVWLAEDTQLDGKLFAIKMLPSILVANKRAYNQLKAEALLAMKLVHPNIVQIRAFEENNGNPFLVMDYIDGETLDDWLGDRSQDSGVSEDEIVRLLKPIAEAIDYAHTEGVVHRDIKPSNVMIRKDGRPFIMDFGIAREIQETMTRVTGKMSSGTLMYMSPEQLNGDAPKKEQDIYSFAAMVYECLKGEPPFSRGNIEYQIMNKEPDPLTYGSSSVPASHVQELGDRCQESGSIASSVMAGLAKKPDDRPKSCVAVLGGAYGNREKKLESGVRSQGSGEAKSQEACERTPEPRGRLFGNITAIILLVFGLAGGIWYWQDSKVKEEARIVAEQKAEAERKAAEEARRIAAEKAKAEKAEAERKQKEEESRIAAEKAKAEERARKAEEARLAAQKEAERNAELEVFRLSSKVKSAHELIDQESSEIKEVFATEIRAFEDIRDSGDEAKEKSRYVITTNFYTQALALATALKVSVEKYHECKELLPKIERAKERADEVNASESLPSGYRSAQNVQGAALAAFKAKRFDECKEKIQEAESLFVSLRTDVINAVLDIAEGHKNNERWEQCKQEADRVLVWDADNAKAIVLKNEALQHLVPSLKVIATIDGEEVRGAKLNDGQKDYILPTIFKLKQGKKYGPYKIVYERGGKSYKGTFDAVTVNWFGLKTLTMALKQYTAPRHGDRKMLNLPGGETMTMIYVAPGSFMMGSPSSEEGRNDNETQHHVTLTKGYWLGETEVTQAQWESVMGSNPSYFKGASRPVEQVSWKDCQEFIAKVNREARRQLGGEARLPSEAEWEYACRAGSTGKYSGIGDLGGMGWYRGNSGSSTHDVKGKRANAWGFYDMYGNVFEWCQDWYGAYPSGAVTDPNGQASGDLRVLRGGGWSDSARYCRSAFRLRLRRVRLYNCGFRLACSALP